MLMKGDQSVPSGQSKVPARCVRTLFSAGIMN